MCLVAFQKIFRKIFYSVWKRRKENTNPDTRHNPENTNPENTIAINVVVSKRNDFRYTSVVCAVSLTRDRDRRRDLAKRRPQDRDVDRDLTFARSRRRDRDLANAIGFSGFVFSGLWLVSGFVFSFLLFQTLENIFRKIF